MMKIANGGRLDNWIDANLKWLKGTFGEENLVSCVLHMDEKTPHLHATVVPIVTGERIRRKREGEKKYETKSGPRLSADDVMRRTKLHEYQNSYAAAMKPFGAGGQEHHPLVVRQGRPCQSEKGTIGQG